MTSRKIIIFLFAAMGLLLILLLGYMGWNNANPERTCASCHEISPSTEIWKLSAHRDVTCSDCHGSALSNGFHSLKEKSGMLFTHLGKTESQIKVGLNEEGVLAVMEACISCHQDEYKSWMGGGHSAVYSDIFLDEQHNAMERPYPDCFRCHGMYYDGTIADLVEPISTEGPWKLKDPGINDRPVIPCLACHPIHMENEMQSHPGSMSDPDAIFYERADRNPLTGLYLRSERMHLRVDMLGTPDMHLEDTRVLVSDDPIQRLCMQCHAPNWAHEAGTEDDKTPTGVHEGLSCRACHRDHSNNPSKACKTCHPAVSSCGLKVETMNTTYLNRESPFDIHSMTCLNCHNPIP
jgi:hypothetical protein